MGFNCKDVMIMLPVAISILAFFSSTCDASFGNRLGLTNLPLGVHLQNHLQSKMKHAVAGQGGSNGGRISGIGGEGNGGTGSNASPYLQGGGAAVVPIYNAGAGANMHRNNHHHNAGSSVQSFRGSPAIAAILLAHLLRDMYI